MKPPTGPESSSSLRGRPGAPDTLLLQAFSSLDKTALGVAVGALCALTVWGATVLLIAKGGQLVGPTLALLGQYFVGYTVTPRGSVVGALYGFLTGFLLGWITAAIRNVIIAVYVHVVVLRATLAKTQTFIDDLQKVNHAPPLAEGRRDRCRARWPHRGLRTLQSRHPVCRPREGPGRRRPRAHGPLQGPPPRHPPAPSLPEGEAGGGHVARGAADWPVPAAPAALPDLLQQAVLLLSAPRLERPVRAWDLEQLPRRPELHQDPAHADTPGGNVRPLGVEPLRQPSIRDLLQDLHREGLGHPLQRDHGRVGGPTYARLSLFLGM